MPTPGPNRPNTPNNKKPPTPMPSGPGKRGTMLLLSLMWLVMAFLVMFNLMGGAAAGEKIEYGTFRQMITEGKIARVVMTSEKYLIYPKLDGKGNYATPEGPVTGTLVDPMEELEEARKVLEELRSSTPPPIDDVARREAYQAALGSAQASVAALERSQNADAPYYGEPLSGDITLVTLLEENGVTHYSVENPSVFSSLFWTLLPMLLMVGLMYLLFRSLSSKMGGMGGIGGVGKANAKVYVEKETGVTFRDVAGQDEAKESLQEIIDILHNPQKYTEIGAKLPKGVLLVGPPGTGKTLLAKAVAGEANVPFFSISGSDFVEMFVGVGASRVRDLFKEANKLAPCIIFIDEIDTIGKSRDNRMGGNDEREQTLNQLLAELDGFDPTKGVIVLAATNRPEVLDKALLRPGRFDRRITIDRPNLAGRLATLQVHTRNIRLAEDVDLNKIALATAGTVGSDLANLVNEAALRAVRKGRKLVTQEDLLASFECVSAG